MPPHNAELVADGLWRRLRPLIVEVIGATLTEPEPASDEDRYVAESTAKQLERYRAKSSPAATRRRNAKP